MPYFTFTIHNNEAAKVTYLKPVSHFCFKDISIFYDVLTCDN